MQQHSCDLCDNPAVIHETCNCNGIVKRRHLCRAHGLNLWRDALPNIDSHLESLQHDPVFQTLANQANELAQRRSKTGDAR